MSHSFSARLQLLVDDPFEGLKRLSADYPSVVDEEGRRSPYPAAFPFLDVSFHFIFILT